MQSRRPETDAALAAASAGLGLARRRVGAEHIEPKDGIDLVTGADIAAERAIRRVLAERCPNLPIVGEEDGGDTPEEGPYWLVDPICGTRNYASRLALFCTNIALIEDRKVTIAVVGDGGSGELAFAERGRGAFCGSTPLHVREGTVLALELGGKPPYANPAIPKLVQALTADDRYYLRLLGTTLSLAKVGSGDLAGVLLLADKADPLHTAAGCLLAEEAGALVTDLHGEPWTLETRNLVLAATRSVQRDLLRYLER